MKYLRKREETLWNKQASNLLYSCRNLRHNDKDQSLEFLDTIASKMSKSTEGAFASQAIGNSLFGLQHFNNSSSEMKSLFRILTLKIITCEESMKSQELCNALFGLKNMTASGSEMHRLLNFFAEQIEEIKDPFTGQGLAMAICGLQTMDTNCVEVRMVMSALAKKIGNSKSASFTEEGMSMALYSFRNKNNNFPEVKALVEALSVRLLEMDSTVFSGETVANIVNGLSRMNSTHRVFRDLISRITDKIEIPENFVQQSVDAKNWKMSQNDIFKVFCGLYNLNSDQIEVRKLVATLVDRLSYQDECDSSENSTQDGDIGVVLESKVLANSLYSLRNMKNNRNEVNYMLNWIATHLNGALIALETSTGKEADIIRKKLTFNPSEIGKSLYGLRSMSMASREGDVTCAIKDTNLSRVLAALHKLLRITSGDGRTSHHAMSLEQVSLAVFGMRGLHGSHPEVDALLLYIFENHQANLQAETLAGLEPDVLSSRIARILYGLQGKLCDGNVGGNSIMELIYDILEHPELHFEFSPKSFCASICGLGNGSGVGTLGSERDGVNEADIEESRRILLRGIVKRSPNKFSPDSLKIEHDEDSRMDRHLPSYGLVLQGLSGMSSENDDVRIAVGLLAQSMSTLPCSSENELSDVILGFSSLSNMSSSFEEVRSVLDFLNERLLRHDTGRISIDEVSRIMMGMQRMHSTHNKVSKVLTNVRAILASHRAAKKEVLAMRNLATIIYGLQSSSSSDGVVKKLLSELCGIIDESEESSVGVITGRQLMFCLVGMQNMDLAHAEVQKLWRILLSTLDNSPTRITRSSIEKSLAILKKRTDTGGKSLVEDMERLLHEKITLLNVPVSGAVSP